MTSDTLVINYSEKRIKGILRFKPKLRLSVLHILLVSHLKYEKKRINIFRTLNYMLDHLIASNF